MQPTTQVQVWNNATRHWESIDCPVSKETLMRWREASMKNWLAYKTKQQNVGQIEEELANVAARAAIEELGERLPRGVDGLCCCILATRDVRFQEWPENDRALTLDEVLEGKKIRWGKRIKGVR